MSSSPLLEVRRLSRSFEKNHPILKEVSFSLSQGSWTILAGTNGSGKTVLMNHLNGLEKPDQGEVLFRGQKIRSMGDEIRRKVGLVFQNSDLQFVEQTVERELAFGPQNLKLPKEEIRQRIEQVKDELGLEEFMNRRPHSLSGGEKKRVAIGGILAMEPELLVLDEPFTGLDWNGVNQVLHTLIELHKKGMTILLITHDLGKCAAHADRLILMGDGEIGMTGTVEEVLPHVEKWGVRKPEGLTWLK
ncbi:MAG: ABC transporter ATP-binding protein [Spirochaetales bacterium]|nr:ABC transporter ATP-binding protein [Spirochaetales bacterium]